MTREYTPLTLSLGMSMLIELPSILLPLCRALYCPSPIITLTFVRLRVNRSSRLETRIKDGYCIEDTRNRRKLGHCRLDCIESCVNREPKLSISFQNVCFVIRLSCSPVIFTVYFELADIATILIILAVIKFLNSASARWYATMVPNRFYSLPGSFIGIPRADY